MTTTQSKQLISLHGILLLDKPLNMTSNFALQRVKRLLNARKAGHTGSLDPLATGMLPICLGHATKFSQYLLEADKVYLVSAKLGVRTTTGDAEGEILVKKAVPEFSREQLDEALDHFRGEIRQTPSMYSALKFNGQPLYQLARQGITVDRPERQLTVYSLTFLDYLDEILDFKIHCSKGTYVRTIVEDLGELLGCGAHVVFLRRLAVGSYREENMVSLQQLEQSQQENDTANLMKHIIPIETCAQHWPTITLSTSQEFILRQKRAIKTSPTVAKGTVKICNDQGKFIGVGELTDDLLAAHRLL